MSTTSYKGQFVPSVRGIALLCNGEAEDSVTFSGIEHIFKYQNDHSDKGRRQNSKDVVTNLPLKLATSGN